jgi:hypothetical protein
MKRLDRKQPVKQRFSAAILLVDARLLIQGGGTGGGR